MDLHCLAYEDPSVQFEEGLSLSHLASALGSWPKLESLQTNFLPDSLDFATAPRLTALSTTRPLLIRPATFELGDNVTNFAIIDFQNKMPDMAPKFRNLTTFSLTFGETSEKFLNQIVHWNPNLVNMSLELNFLPHKVSYLFHKLQRLYLECDALDLRSVLLGAPKLKQLVFAVKHYAVKDEEAFSLAWLVEAVAKKQISQDLEVIQIGFDQSSDLIKAVVDWTQQLRGCQGEGFTEEDCEKIVVPVNDFVLYQCSKVVLDIRAISKLCRY